MNLQAKKGHILSEADPKSEGVLKKRFIWVNSIMIKFLHKKLKNYILLAFEIISIV